MPSITRLMPAPCGPSLPPLREMPQVCFPLLPFKVPCCCPWAVLAIMAVTQSCHKGTLYRGMQALEVMCLTELIITALQNSRGRRMPTRVLVVRCRKAQLVSVGVQNMEKALAPRSVGGSWGSHALLGERRVQCIHILHEEDAPSPSIPFARRRRFIGSRMK